MHPVTIQNNLINYFQKIPDVSVSLTTALVDEGILDSMGVMELLTYLEKHYLIQFSDDDLTIDNFRTVISIAQMVINKMENQTE